MLYIFRSAVDRFWQNLKISRVQHAVDNFKRSSLCMLGIQLNSIHQLLLIGRKIGTANYFVVLLSSIVYSFKSMINLLESHSKDNNNHIGKIHLIMKGI